MRAGVGRSEFVTPIAGGVRLRTDDPPGVGGGWLRYYRTGAGLMKSQGGVCRGLCVFVLLITGFGMRPRGREGRFSAVWGQARLYGVVLSGYLRTQIHPAAAPCRAAVGAN